VGLTLDREVLRLPLRDPFVIARAEQLLDLLTKRRSEVVLRVTDAGGAEQRVVALASPELRLATGEPVYLVAYDAQRDRFAIARTDSG